MRKNQKQVKRNMGNSNTSNNKTVSRLLEVVNTEKPSKGNTSIAGKVGNTEKPHKGNTSNNTLKKECGKEQADKSKTSNNSE